MKNRCIIVKTPDNTTNFICLGENNSVVASNTAYGIELYSPQIGSTITLKTFSISEIKDRLYDRLCYFLQYGKISVINEQGGSVEVNAFDIEQQIKDIKWRYKI